MQVSVSVPFVNANFNKCLCPRCPVQATSKCVSTKMADIKNSVNKHPLNYEDIPGVYCSSGTATCTDIRTEQDCQCGHCVVFPEYKLFNYNPSGHYCRDGTPK